MYDESGHLLGEYDGTGNAIQEVVWLGDTLGATVRQEACGLSIFYIHTDHLNTPRRITRRSTSDVVWSCDSDPFGAAGPNENPSGPGSFSFNLRFPGQYYDAETALNYKYFRDYDPATGGYVESDPIGLGGGINTYAYVRSNPLSGKDRFGLDDEPIRTLPPDPNNDPNYTGAGQKAYNACEAADRLAAALRRKAEARAKDNWAEYYKEVDAADRALSDYYRASGQPVSVPPTSHPPAPPVPAAPAPVAPAPNTPIAPVAPPNIPEPNVKL